MTTAANRQVIADEEARFFLENGFLVLKEVVKGEELRRLRRAMDELTAYGSAAVREHPDFSYAPGHKTGQPVLRRIEYVIDKYEECKALLGHPFVLRSVEKMIGPDLIPTWDSMVLKLPGEGIIVPWHRDAGTANVGDTPIFNVDFYMDEADLDTCLWVYPGSHLWSEDEVLKITRQEGFSTEGAVPVLMQPGDVIFHNILLVHGSPSNTSDKLRRVIYYEFRAAHVERDKGPHIPEYIPLKQRVLSSCLEKRAAADYIAPEEPYRYHPPAPFVFEWTPGTVLETYRYPHDKYWRK
ncbi:MAG: phytanoyl-CoA dioxygenase family protein [Armatimonadetes bacterium]|nr:phytanoyl-CoA dioxygenase family protein [Armatimonadota bacterium]